MFTIFFKTLIFWLPDSTACHTSTGTSSAIYRSSAVLIGVFS